MTTTNPTLSIEHICGQWSSKDLNSLHSSQFTPHSSTHSFLSALFLSLPWPFHRRTLLRPLYLLSLCPLPPLHFSSHHLHPAVCAPELFSSSPLPLISSSAHPSFTASYPSPSINSLPCWSLRSSLPAGGCCRPDGCKGCSPQTPGWKAFADGRQMRQNTNEKWLTNKRRKRDKQK